MSSLDSHTMVPTLTMLGRFSVWIRELRFAVPEPVVVVVTSGLCPAVQGAARPGWRRAGAQWSPTRQAVDDCAPETRRQAAGGALWNCRRPDTRTTTARRKPDGKPPGAGLGPVLLAYDERVR